MKAVDPSGLPLVYPLRGCGRDGGGRRKWFSADKGAEGASGLTGSMHGSLHWVLETSRALDWPEQFFQ
jgi:hypothetical protein